MSLQQCITQRRLGDHLEKGLKALGANSKRVTVQAPRKATHSVALDDSLKSAHPNAPRWDYGIGLSQGTQHTVAWVEVHTATSSEVDSVLKKLAWLQQWLAQANDACRRTPSTFYWAATDAGVHIDSARRRRLNAAGLRMPQSHWRI